MIGQLYYCPQCEIVYLKFPDIQRPEDPRLTHLTRYLQCPRCSGDFEGTKVDLRPIASPSHVLVNK